MQQILAEVPSLTVFGAIAGIVITAIKLGASRQLARSWLMRMTLLALLAIILVVLSLRIQVRAPIAESIGAGRLVRHWKGEAELSQSVLAVLARSGSSPSDLSS